MGQNYFNTLPLRLQLEELGKCRFMDEHEFADGVAKLKGKKIVIIGCGAQGLHQGLNLRDSGLDVSYALRDSAISEKRQSWKNATENGFTVQSLTAPGLRIEPNTDIDPHLARAAALARELMRAG